MDGRIKSGHDEERRNTLEANERDVVAKKKEATMPEVIVNMVAGRTDDQKKGMMFDITQALVKNLGVDAEVVTVQINEAPLTHKMKGGKTFLERKAAAK